MSRTDILAVPWNQPGDLFRKQKYEINPAQEQVAMMLSQIGRAFSGLGDRWNNLDPAQQKMYIAAALIISFSLVAGGVAMADSNGGNHTAGHTGIAHAQDAGFPISQIELGRPVGPGYQPLELAPMCKPGDMPVVAPKIEMIATSTTCNEVLFNTINTKGGVNFKPGAEVAILGNPVNWDNARVNLAKGYWGDSGYASILDYVRGLPSNIKVQKVIRTGGEWSVVLTKGNKEVWAVDAKGQFLGKQDGSSSNFADLPTVPEKGLRLVRKVDSGCSLTYAVDSKGTAKYAYNPLFGKWNTIGQLLGVEPSYQEATEQARLDNPVAVATSLGIENCPNCQFVPTEWGKRLDDPKLGTLAWQMGGKWEKASDCGKLDNVQMKRGGNYNSRITAGRVCSREMITDNFPLYDGNGNKVGVNEQAFLFLYRLPNGKQVLLTVSVLATDNNGNLVIGDREYTFRGSPDPEQFYGDKIGKYGRRFGFSFFDCGEDAVRNIQPDALQTTRDFEAAFYKGKKGIVSSLKAGNYEDPLFSAGFSSDF